MVIYVRVRMLLPCWIVVWLSAKAVWVSTTFVMVDIYSFVSPSPLILFRRCTHSISQTSDLLDIELCFFSDINKHPMPFLELINDTVVLLNKVDILLQGVLLKVSFALLISA